MKNESGAEVYLLHVWIRQISPMIWRRILVRSGSTIADLHGDNTRNGILRTLSR